MLLLTLAIGPSLAILLFILYKDKLNREPVSVLLLSFFWGVLSVIPAYFIESAAGYFALEETVEGTLVYVFFAVALVEELVKFVPLRFYAFTRHSFDEPLDGIVHGVMIGLGFATIENIGYVLSAENGIQVGLMRMFLSVPGHAAYGVIMGYYFGKARFNEKNRLRLMLTGLLLATFFHGLYDSCLFLTKKVDENVAIVLVLAAITTDIFAYILAARLIKQHRLLSKGLYKDAPLLTIKHAVPADAQLIRNLAQRIWPSTYNKIISRAQIAYMMEMMYSVAALQKQMTQGHQFILVYNNSIPVGFAAFSNIGNNVYKLHKIYLLPNQQGRGTGKFCIEQVIADITPAGATALLLNVNRFNKAKSFYEKLGFSVIREEKIDIGNGFVMDDYVMEKKLKE